MDTYNFRNRNLVICVKFKSTWFFKNFSLEGAISPLHSQCWLGASQHEAEVEIPRLACFRKRPISRTLMNVPHNYVPDRCLVSRVIIGKQLVRGDGRAHSACVWLVRFCSPSTHSSEPTESKEQIVKFQADY